MIRQYFKDTAVALGIEYDNEMTLNDLKRSVSNLIKNLSIPNKAVRDENRLDSLIGLRKTINTYSKGLPVEEVERYELELYAKEKEVLEPSSEPIGKWDDYIEFVRDDKSSFLLMPRFDSQDNQVKFEVPVDLNDPSLGTVNVYEYYLLPSASYDNKVTVYMGMSQEEMLDFIDNDINKLNYFKNVFMSESRVQDSISIQYDNLDAKHKYFGSITNTDEGYESITEDNVVTMLSGKEFLNGTNYFYVPRTHMSYFGIKPVMKDGNQRSSIIRSDGGILKRLYTYEVVDKNFKDGAKQHVILELNSLQLFNLMTVSSKKNKFSSNYMNINDFDNIFSYNPDNPNALFGYPGDLEKTLSCTSKNFLRQIDKRIVEELKLQKITEVEAFIARLELEADAKNNI